MSLMPSQGEGRDYRVRYVWVLAAAITCFVVLVGRLYYLQVSRRDYYAERSRSNFVKRIDIPADRGMILDSRGTILVDGRPSYEVDLTPAFCSDVPGTLARLVGVIGLDAEHLARVTHRIRAAHGLERFRPVVVAKDVSRDALDWIEGHRLELDGVDVRTRPQRNYRYGKTLAHVLGYMNEISREELDAAEKKGLPYKLGDSIGRGGLEARFEKQLRGTDGLEQVVVDAKGRRIDTAETADEGAPTIPEDERVRPSIPGHNLVLSIDMRLQQVAQKTFSAKAGAVVAVDPQTGYILAMVSKPSFDPNELSAGISPKQMKALADDPYDPMLFRAIQQQYPPGSTFKPFVALAGLETGTVTASQGTTCHGGYTLGRRRWRCWKATGHGFMDMVHAIQHSCDTYFYWLGDQLGVDKIAHMARQFGFGSPTGIGLPHEVPGIIPDEKWYDAHAPYGYQRGFALNDAIGQGDINVTPLQQAMAYAAIGNGGTVYLPQVVRRIEDANGHVLEEFLPKVERHVEVKPEYLATVVKGLTMVVMQPGGTAYYHRPRHLGIDVAGKTGTAQVIRMGKVRVKTNDMSYWEKDHGWFVAFAPAQKPEIAVAVLAEHGGHGGSSASPTAMAVIEAYFRFKKQDEADRRMPGPPARETPVDVKPAGGRKTTVPASALATKTMPKPAPAPAPRPAEKTKLTTAKTLAPRPATRQKQKPAPRPADKSTLTSSKMPAPPPAKKPKPAPAPRPADKSTLTSAKTPAPPPEKKKTKKKPAKPAKPTPPPAPPTQPKKAPGSG